MTLPANHDAWLDVTRLGRNHGGSHAPLAAGTATLAANFASGCITLDITALAQSWVDGVSPNYGVILTLSTSETFHINSKENAANPPQNLSFTAKAGQVRRVTH